MPTPTSDPPSGPPSDLPRDPPVGSSASEFDAFYLSSRRRLVLEAYALTGDLSAARSAVSDAFVVAGHHWRKVGRLRDPEEWVRSRAWAMAQRRHVARLWHRERGLSSAQKGTLDALHHLPDQQRKALLLCHLAGLAAPGIGRELGETPGRVEQKLAAATAAFCAATGIAEDGVLAAMESLASVAEAAALPRPLLIRRSSRRRQRLHAVAGVAGLVALTLLAGLFVVSGGTEQQALATDTGPAAGKGPAAKPVTAAMLLNVSQVQPLAPTQAWHQLGTSDNTSGTGINTVCQDSRFADRRGRGTFVRTFTAGGVPRRKILQTVEISRTPGAAAAAYRTTLGWFAGCDQARLQLLNAYRIRGLGEAAEVLKLRIPGAVRRTYVVGVVRTASLTVSTVLETMNGAPVEVPRVVSALTASVRNLCGSDPSGPCPTSVSTDPVLPPPSGESRGSLAAADLPVIGSLNRPWVGTQPVPARPNLAATTCDKASFVSAGSPRSRSRTFLIPQANLPRRFGITETIGSFGTRSRAEVFVRSIASRMASCEKRDLGARVSSVTSEPLGYRRSQYVLWRLDSEINKTTSVGYWMGIARVGPYVAQVNFTPTGVNDVDQETFQALISRARDRLFELPGSAR